MENFEKLIPAKQVPKILPVKLSTVRALIFQRRLPVVRLGRRVYVKESVLKRIAENGLESVAEESGQAA